MSGWVSESELTSRMGYKLLIAGLSEAGKTAVKKIFFLKKHAKDVDKQAATINYERMSVTLNGVPLTIVDLGGQKVFIKRFLSNFSPFIFSSVHAFLFVIDVSKKETRKDSIEYFSNCVQKLKAYSPNAKYFVFLHKNDLVIQSPNYESIHAQLKEQFQLENEEEKINFLRTTIFKPEIVINAFGRIIELVIPQGARSEYVEYHDIGAVEEFATKFMTLKATTCSKCGSPVRESAKELICSYCGHIEPIKEAETTPAPSQVIMLPTSDSQKTETPGDNILEKLNSLMQSAIIKDDQPAASSTQVSTGSENQLEDLQSLMRESLVRDSQKGLKPMDVMRTSLSAASNSSPPPPPPPAPIEKTYVKQTADTPLEEDVEERNMHISYLVNFFGIKDDVATRLIKEGYAKTFEAAAKIGIPIDLILKVFFKYLPFIEKKGIDTASLTEIRLMEIFNAYVNGLIVDEEMFDAFIFALKREEMTIENIIEKFLVTKRDKIALKMKMDVSRATSRLAENPEIPKLPLKAEKETKIVMISKEKTIGIILEKDDQNCKLTFFKGNKMLEETSVSGLATQNDIKYLLSVMVEIPGTDKVKLADELASTLYAQIQTVMSAETKKI